MQTDVTLIWRSGGGSGTDSGSRAVAAAGFVAVVVVVVVFVVVVVVVVLISLLLVIVRLSASQGTNAKPRFTHRPSPSRTTASSEFCGPYTLHYCLTVTVVFSYHKSDLRAQKLQRTHTT